MRLNKLTKYCSSSRKLMKTTSCSRGVKALSWSPASRQSPRCSACAREGCAATRSRAVSYPPAFSFLSVWLLSCLPSLQSMNMSAPRFVGGCHGFPFGGFARAMGPPSADLAVPFSVGCPHSCALMCRAHRTLAGLHSLQSTHPPIRSDARLPVSRLRARDSTRIPP